MRHLVAQKGVLSKTSAPTSIGGIGVPKVALNGPAPTLDGPFEECLAGLAGGHAVVIARSNVSAHQTQPFGDGVEHVLALDGRILHDTAGTVLVALATRGGPQPSAREHGRRVQPVGVGAQGQAEAAAGVGGSAGTVVAEGVNARGRAGRFGLDERTTTGPQVPVIRGHPAEQPVDTEQGSQHVPSR